MKSINCGLYNFESIIENNYLYVDKTEYLYNLIQERDVSYFLSRPRRFGKSLTISTLKCIFEGKKELFEGLAISKKDYDWKKYPIINLSLADLDPTSTTASTVLEDLESHINKIAKEQGISLTEKLLAKRFSELIDQLYEQGPVVIFVDEYDKPILNNIESSEIKDILAVLKGFYSVLKAQNAKIRFLFVTGVTKFAHVSIFSDLNNLQDITMNPKYATMLGYTQKELEDNFAEHMEAACLKRKYSKEYLSVNLKKWYDGYTFEEESESVYNPVSIAYFFTNGYKFNNYWFDTGSPSFLLKLAKKKNFDIESELSKPVDELTFKGFEIDNISPLTLMLQTGYLTIKNSIIKFDRTKYFLDFPNLEVKSAYSVYLLNEYTGIDKEKVSNFIDDFCDMVGEGNVEGFMEIMKTLFASITYEMQIPNEKYYQTIFFFLFKVMGINIEAESRTNNGRIDAVATYQNYVYIFEFKINQPATKALEQIKEKAYYQKFANSGKTIILVGASFSIESRQITEYTSTTC